MDERSAAPVAALAAFAAVAALFVLPYVADELAYPLGWDSPFYVWRTAAIGVDGLDRLGGVRPATPLLFHALGTLTGTGPFTIAAIGPALFAAVAGLAAAGLLRSAFGIGAGWVPVTAVIAWIGFGHPGMVREQPDNVLNAAMTLAAFGAAISYVRGGRGVWAVGVLLAGAGLAHWPFYALAVAVLGLAVVTFSGRRLVSPDAGEEVRRSRRVLGAAAASAVAVGAAGLWRPPAAWRAPRLEQLREILLDRFRRRVSDPHRIPVLPVAGLGLAAASRRRDLPGRRLFLHLMLAWIALTAVGVALQAAGVPTAGLRLLNHLFPLTLLAAVVLWWLVTHLGRAVGVAAAAAAVLGFGALAVPFQLEGRPWYEPQAVRQAASASAWLSAQPEVRAVVTIAARHPLTAERRRNTVLAAMSPEAGRRVRFRNGSIADGFSFTSEVVIALRAYDRAGFETLLRAGREVADGVAVFTDRPPVQAAPPVAVPVADTGPGTIALVLAAGAVALLGAGLGWARVLLPADPLLTWTLAPTLGGAITAIVGVAWAAVGLPLDGAAGAGPLALTAFAGVAAAVRGRAAGWS